MQTPAQTLADARDALTRAREAAAPVLSPDAPWLRDVPPVPLKHLFDSDDAAELEAALPDLPPEGVIVQASGHATPAPQRPFTRTAQERLDRIVNDIKKFVLLALPDDASPEDAVGALINAHWNQAATIKQYQKGSPGADKGSPEPDPSAPRQSVLLEAEGLVHGDRNHAYGHPLDGFLQSARMTNAYLEGKYNRPVELTPEDLAVIIILVKLSRQSHRAKRDNYVDIAGYAEVAQWMLDESARRSS